jgi:ABC-type spermidine/putrescine transport system permease subunit I
MDELKFFGGLTGITILVISLLVYLGRKLSRAAERNVEFIDLPLYVTRTGTTFFACVAAFWVYCAAVRVLAPGSNLGEYLGTFDGAAAVIFGSIIFAASAWLVSNKLGYPFAKWNKDSDSG